MSDAIKMNDFSINQRYDLVNLSLISHFFIYSQNNGLERANTGFNNTGKFSNGVGWTYHQNNHNVIDYFANGQL